MPVLAVPSRILHHKIIQSREVGFGDMPDATGSCLHIICTSSIVFGETPLSEVSKIAILVCLLEIQEISDELLNEYEITQNNCLFLVT